MADILSTPLFGIGLTLVIYALAQKLYARTRHVLLNPVAVTVLAIIAVLLLADIP